MPYGGITGNYDEYVILLRPRVRAVCDFSVCLARNANARNGNIL